MRGSFNEKIYAFIDSQNLNLGLNKDLFKNGKKVYEGWNLDFSRFYIYLQNKFRIDKAYLFIGYIKKYENLYQYLRECGYEIIFKPTIKDKTGKAKGNVDAEIVLYVSAILYRRFNKAVFVSGDGDFYCLYKFLEERNKLQAILIPNKYTGSSLLNKFEEYKYFIYRDRKKLEKINGRRRTLSRR
ncbi:MAG: NYN domain-containing protein [Candidatus Dojkabacteria bacterium]|nr:NYN domain-containing protein [Candidatus Dojkabacteria bacterium]